MLQPEQRNQIVVDEEAKPSTLESPCLNYEVLRKAGLALICDYLCEHITLVEHTTWLMVNYVHSIVASIKESPVQDFIISIHKSSSSSGLLLQAIITRVTTIGSDVKVRYSELFLLKFFFL